MKKWALVPLAALALVPLTFSQEECSATGRAPLLLVQEISVHNGFHLSLRRIRIRAAMIAALANDQMRMQQYSCTLP
jgi:hypothetical protein